MSEGMAEEKSAALSADDNSDLGPMGKICAGKNPRGIPAAKFIESVEDFLTEMGDSVEVSLGAFNELYTKYKYMESSFERSKGIYKSKLPEIEQTLELVKVLKAKKDDDEEMITNFSLCDMVYSKAKVDAEAGIVGLWIGANIMVEYTHEEAIDLLTEQLSATKIKITELDEDLYFLRGNAITVEVNMARLFNHSVKLKKEAETKAGKA